jgi:hypothetical protein
LISAADPNFDLLQALSPGTNTVMSQSQSDTTNLTPVDKDIKDLIEGVGYKTE